MVLPPLPSGMENGIFLRGLPACVLNIRSPISVAVSWARKLQPMSRVSAKLEWTTFLSVKSTCAPGVALQGTRVRWTPLMMLMAC